jgi:hypothetical protein
MPEIARFQGIVITMYHSDPERHPVAHFHARYGEYRASFAIDPPVLLAGVMPRRQLQMILGWAELRNAELQQNWRKLLEQEIPTRIDGLR